MAKAIKKELDQNGNIVEVEVNSDLIVKKEAPVKKYEPKEYIFKLVDKFYSTYLEGVSTIFEDEQEHLSEQKKKQRPEIRFIYGTLVVPAHKTSLVKFLTVSNMNSKTVKRMPNTRPVY